MGEPLLKGKVVVIGGASKNLGSLISKSLGAEGASIVVHYNSASSSRGRGDGGCREGGRR